MRLENVKAGEAYMLKVGKNPVQVTVTGVDEKGKITVALAEGRFTIKAFNKPEKKGEETARSKQIAKRPYGTHDLTNDVRMFVEAAYDANDEIVFKVEFRRIEE